MKGSIFTSACEIWMIIHDVKWRWIRMIKWYLKGFCHITPRFRVRRLFQHDLPKIHILRTNTFKQHMRSYLAHIVILWHIYSYFGTYTHTLAHIVILITWFELWTITLVVLTNHNINNCNIVGEINSIWLLWVCSLDCVNIIYMNLIDLYINTLYDFISSIWQ
jgi:hypothetical protein